MFKRQVAAIFFVILAINAGAQDTTIHPKPITVSGNIQVTNNGTAPVPIFALGRPAIIGSTTIRKGRFYVNLEQYFGLDTKPWTMNNRLGFFIVDNKNLTLTFSTNISLFFLDRNPQQNHGEEFQTQRYWANELTAEYRITPNRKLQFLYWHTNDVDKLGVNREEFINLAFMFDNVMLGSKNLITFKPSVFYLFDDGALEGVLTTEALTYQRIKWKFNLFIQATFMVHVVPHNNMTWNCGVNVPF